MTDSSNKTLFESHQLTTGLILLLILEVATMTTYSFWTAREALQPDSLADQAEAVIQKNYPKFRETLTSEMKQKSPMIAEELSDDLLASGPDVRQWLEQTTARQIEYGLDEATELSADQFREFLQENREQVLDIFEQLDDAPEQARELVLNLEMQFDKQLGVDLQDQARTALKFHQALNTKLEKITSNAPLEPKELLEKRIFRILKTYQMRRIAELNLVN